MRGRRRMFNGESTEVLYGPFNLSENISSVWGLDFVQSNNLEIEVLELQVPK